MQELTVDLFSMENPQAGNLRLPMATHVFAHQTHAKFSKVIMDNYTEYTCRIDNFMIISNCV